MDCYFTRLFYRKLPYNLKASIPQITTDKNKTRHTKKKKTKQNNDPMF